MVATISADGSGLYCGSFGGILGTALAKVEVPPELYRVTCLSRLIALPTSDGGSIARAVSRYLRQSVSPRPAPIILLPIFVPAHPRNKHTQAAVRCGRARQSRRIVPRQTKAAGSGEFRAGNRLAVRFTDLGRTQNPAGCANLTIR
jgi:hypothetical protein